MDDYTQAQLRALGAAIDAIENAIREIKPYEKPTQFKSMNKLAADLREHAYRYALEDAGLRSDLIAAANYLEAVAND